jgi:hypothetical protein
MSSRDDQDRLSPGFREGLERQIAELLAGAARLTAEADRRTRMAEHLQAVLHADAKVTADGPTRTDRSAKPNLRFGRPVKAGPTEKEQVVAFFKAAAQQRPGEFIHFTEVAAAIPGSNPDGIRRTCARLAEDSKRSKAVLERQGPRYRLRETANVDDHAGDGEHDQSPAPTDLREVRRARQA